MARAAASYEEMARPDAEKYGLDLKQLVDVYRAIWREETGYEARFGEVAWDVALRVLPPSVALDVFSRDSGRSWCQSIDGLWKEWSGKKSHALKGRPRLSDREYAAHQLLVKHHPVFVRDNEIETAYGGGSPARVIVERLKDKGIDVQSAKSARGLGDPQAEGASGYRLA